ncbi:serine hydrolase domain-containing protein [Oxalobacteraceae bacterium A2-2]
MMRRRPVPPGLPGPLTGWRLSAVLVCMPGWMRACMAAGMAMLLAALPVQAQDDGLERVLQSWDRDEHPDLRAVVILRSGRLAAERYYNGETADTLHDIRSAGKSITALLAGAAIDRGLVAGVDDTVQRYWPQSQGSAVGGVVLADLLTMRSGLAAFDEDPKSPGNEDFLDEAADPLAYTLTIPRETAPGTRYRYNSLASYLTGIVIEQASGQDLEAFAREALFAPLDIQRWHWGRDVAGHPKGQGNLSLAARDLARIGQMVLDGGVYQGRRVISAAWLRAALAPRVAIADVDRYADGYGYFWYFKTHEIDGRKVEVSFASGNGGNKLYVIPSRRLVVAVTSSAYGKGYGQRRSEAILKAVLAAELRR